ncbi:MAG: hypothetical protein ABSE16_01605 [Verrucomicrobiota bacterium]|jgi:hypothetical protein
MKYNLPTVAQQDLGIAVDPYLGGTFAVFLSRVPAYLLGQVTLSASGTGAGALSNATWVPSNCTLGASGAILNSRGLAGVDLEVVAATNLSSPSGNCSVQLNVTDENGQPRTATATFAPPARVDDQSGNFEVGIASDLNLDTSGALNAGKTGVKVTAITGVASVLNGDRNVTFSIYQLPNLTDYVQVGVTTEKKFNIKSRKPVGIDAGMTADAFVVLGKTKPGDLTIDSKFGGMADRLTRFDGARCTAMLQGIKDGVITCDTLVFVNFIPSVEVNLPEGEGEAMENAAQGKFQDHLWFVAP